MANLGIGASGDTRPAGKKKNILDKFGDLITPKPKAPPPPLPPKEVPGPGNPGDPVRSVDELRKRRRDLDNIK